jgi:phosphate starvation-inducible PhoH-like protein
MSGLRHAIEVLEDIPGVSFNFFQSKDVVRHPVVGRIIDAYDAHEQQGNRLKLEKHAAQQAKFAQMNKNEHSE